MSYSNPDHGVRRAIAAILEITIEEVEVAPVGDGTFAIVQPEGASPDPAAVLAWEPAPDPDPAPVTDVERVSNALHPKLDGRESQRRANVAKVRALAAAAMMLADWQLPDDLSEPTTAGQLAGLVATNQLATIVAYLTTDLQILAGDATEEDQQKRAVQYVRVMTEGARFGKAHSDGLGAYERTASLDVVADIAGEEASAGWRALPCEGYDSIGALFPAFLR